MIGKKFKNPPLLLFFLPLRYGQVVVRDIVTFDAPPEVVVIGDDERELRLEVAGLPSPEQVYQAVVVLGYEDGHLLRSVGVGNAPVHIVAAGDGRESPVELLAGDTETVAFDLEAHEEVAAPADELIG